MNRFPYVLTGILMIVGGALLALGGRAENDPSEEYERESGMTSGDENVRAEKATFAAGCFWGVEETFRNIDGVISTSVGYTGGRTDDPSYKEVCSDETGHAEAVEVVFDPEKVKYEDLLTVFWEAHDPTTLNYQGPDFGTQYRSAVFYHSPEQQATAEKSKADLAKSGKFKRPIVTEITEASSYFMAEDYHQQYLAKRGLGSCRTN